MRFYRFLVSDWNPKTCDFNIRHEYAESLEEIKERREYFYGRKNKNTCIGPIQVAEYVWKYLDGEEVSHTEKNFHRVCHDYRGNSRRSRKLHSPELSSQR